MDGHFDVLEVLTRTKKEECRKKIYKVGIGENPENVWDALVRLKRGLEVHPNGNASRHI